MQVQVHTDPGAFASLREEWHDLLGRSFGDRLFQRPAWLGSWWQVFGTGGALRLTTVRDGGGRLVGVAPLFLAQVAADASQAVPSLSVERPVPNPAATEHQALMLVGGTEVSDYLDLIVDRTQAPAVYRALLDAFPEMGEWEWIDLQSLPNDSPTPQQLGDLATAAGMRVTLAPDEVCPVIPLPNSWEAYLSMLGKKERHELRRKMNRLAEAGELRILGIDDLGGLDTALARFIALHEASTPDKADFMRDERMRRFFRLIAQAAFESGWLDLRFLAIDGELAATMFCFRYGGAEQVYNSGFDPRAWPSLSPGIVLLGHMIKQAIEAGLHEFDFLQGNERYKYDLGARDRPLHRLLIRRR